jgi:hypothetical protein
VWFSSRAEWEDYARAYVESCGPAVLCDFHYDFLTTGDRGLFVENVAALRAVADEYGLPFWSIVQLVEHGPYRALTPGELRWQVAMLLAYGARGVGYFTYWTPAPDPYWNFQSAVIGWDGRRSPWYDVLAEFNPVVRAAGRALAGATWLGTGHAGSVPRSGLAFVPDDVVRAVEGRAAIGAFAEPGGARLLLVANADSMASRVIALELDSAAVVERLGGADGAWAPQPTNPSSGGRRLELELPSGMFALLRVTGDCAGVHAAGAPREFAVRPNPARGEVRLTFAPRRSATRCDLLDAAGRRVWSGVAGPGAGELVWRGESDAGGSAPPGVYLARVSDPAGVATRRVVWLGAR